MTATPSPDALEIAQALIRCPSVTPAEAGALTYLQGVLEAAGFACHRLPFSEAGTPDVDNLFARIGNGAPHICFAGHTDVVPPGDEADWSHPPFAAEIADGVLYGRGASDMKGGVAAFAAAALAFAADKKDALPGSISLLITGDEEGPSINGTKKVLDWMAEGEQIPDHSVVGEPTNPEALGDSIKIGRRGSLYGHITVTGEQGHSAYPHLAANPIPGLLAVMNAFHAEPLDEGSEHFAPSDLQITSIDTGNLAPNVIPARAAARFNVRYNDIHTAERLETLLRKQAEAALEGNGLHLKFEVHRSSPSFLTPANDLIDVMQGAVEEVTGRRPERSTEGGTSDARFIMEHCPVIEFGLVNTTIHQVDENTSIKDLEDLTKIYNCFIGRYFEAFA